MFVNGEFRKYEESRITKYPSLVETGMCRTLDLSDRSIQSKEISVLTADTPHLIPVAGMLCPGLAPQVQTMIENK